MLRPPAFIAPRRSGKQRDGTREVLEAGHHITVYEKISWRRERLWGTARHTAEPVIPPAPLTGDVGRGCGDASRALLFMPRFSGPVQTRIVFVIIVADERGNPTLYRVVYDVLKFAGKGDLSIYRPTLKIIMPAPIA
jgi:hypothetical protein